MMRTLAPDRGRATLVVAAIVLALPSTPAEQIGDAAQQHREKVERVARRVEKIEAGMKPLGKTVAMEPIVAD
jgi:hypothetical protein